MAIPGILCEREGDVLYYNKPKLNTHISWTINRTTYYFDVCDDDYWPDMLRQWKPHGRAREKHPTAAKHKIWR